MQLIAQPGERTSIAIASAFANGPSSFDAAVAYVTFSGVQELLRATRLEGLPAMQKRFLVGVDWFRSEPSALDALAALPASHVRVVDGQYMVATKRCQPRRTYHPKAYLVTGSSKRLVVGSANLSKNGLSQSIELSLATTQTQAVGAFEQWFSNGWNTSDVWGTVRDQYKSRYSTERRREFAVTDDDDAPDEQVFRIRWVTRERLQLARSAQNLWVDVGHLHNRDPQGLPGTDLQFTQMTRVFFGSEPRVVPGNTHLADVPLTMAGASRQVRPLVFNDASSMDRMSLPVPGQGGWPAAYDDQTLLFTKWEDGTFRVTMAAPGQRTTWRQRSQVTGFTWEMSGGRREWGVF
ncbi:MAG TPA: phospholipase D-like domain-containing protein [Phycisphaerales bacterium]|nr:phospholipase D-like domain-containing protein [Phycisphaerales bacterium]